MKTFFRNLIGGLAGALFVLGALSPFASTAFALTIPATYPPREFQTQQTHYIRFTFNFNSCVLIFKSTSGYCSVKVGALPYNSFILRGYQQVSTAFNSGNNDSLALGVDGNTTDTQFVALQGVRSAGGASSLTIVAANVGTTAVGNGAPQLGADGGFDVYVQYQTLGTAPTAGSATIVLEYAAPNDGACTAVPMNTQAPAC